jgi:hypothetical protein
LGVEVLEIAILGDEFRVVNPDESGEEITEEEDWFWKDKPMY